VTKHSRPAKRLAKLSVFALVVHLFVIPQVGGAHKALSVFGSVNPILLAVALACEIASFVAYSRLTLLLIPKAHRPTLA